VRSAARKKKPTPTLEDRAAALIEEAEVLREEAEEILTALADKLRHSNMPRDSLKRIWEAKALIHCPVLALKAALGQT
jgi:hypothetical protein